MKGTTQSTPDSQRRSCYINFAEHLLTRIFHKFNKARADDAMNHLLRRLKDFPPNTSVAINLGFN